MKRNIGKVTVAFNNTPRSKVNYRLRLLLSSINSVSKRDQEEDYFHELKSKRPLFVMSGKWFQSIFLVSMFRGLLLVIVVVIDGSGNVIRISWLLNFIVRVL